MNFTVSKLGNAQFHKCPSCGSSSIYEIDTDALCLDCPWDSAAWSVASGAMDDLVYWAEDITAVETEGSETSAPAPNYKLAL
ncbi:MAG: hypothetical protein K2X47_16565 [Bdellovibrionales bacterium]|nr:hypothetical protein [Bdellovibrionales bacterium]